MPPGLGIASFFTRTLGQVDKTHLLPLIINSLRVRVKHSDRHKPNSDTRTDLGAREACLRAAAEPRLSWNGFCIFSAKGIPSAPPSRGPASDDRRSDVLSALCRNHQADR